MFNFVYIYKYEAFAYEVSHIYCDIETGEVGMYLDHPNPHMPTILVKVFEGSICMAKILISNNRKPAFPNYHFIKDTKEYFEDNGLDLAEEVLECISALNVMKKIETPSAVKTVGLII
jgi:hypothetical protein